MKTEVKICGLSTPETLDAAIGAGADHVGFVHFAPSPRHLMIERLIALAARAKGRAGRVAVLVDPDDALLAAVAPHVDVVQLHGRETPERVAAARARLPVWKGVGVRTAADLRDAAARFAHADVLVVDAKPPEGSALPGGNGVRLDWTTVAAARPAGRWFLSGGLDAASVAAALSLARPGGVDVSSGVEDAPGVKSAAKIREFVKVVHGGR